MTVRTSEKELYVAPTVITVDVELEEVIAASGAIEETDDMNTPPGEPVGSSTSTPEEPASYRSTFSSRRR
jgi:hypothetical protein